MNASLLILTLAMAAAESEETDVHPGGLAGLISNTAAAGGPSLRRTEAREIRRSRREVANRRLRSQSLRGGGADASQLIGLIQTTIAPDSWDAPFAAGGFGGNGNGAVGVGSPRDRLIELIQETIEPESWDINGGPGSIGVFAP